MEDNLMTVQQEFVLPDDVKADLEAICSYLGEGVVRKMHENPELLLMNMVKNLRLKMDDPDDRFQPLQPALEMATFDEPSQNLRRVRRRGRRVS